MQLPDDPHNPPKAWGKGTECPHNKDTLPGPQWGLGLPSLSCREQQGLDWKERKASPWPWGRQAFVPPPCLLPDQSEGQVWIWTRRCPVNL